MSRGSARRSATASGGRAPRGKGVEQDKLGAALAKMAKVRGPTRGDQQKDATGHSSDATEEGVLPGADDRGSLVLGHCSGQRSDLPSSTPTAHLPRTVSACTSQKSQRPWPTPPGGEPQRRVGGAATGPRGSIIRVAPSTAIQHLFQMKRQKPSTSRPFESLR